MPVDTLKLARRMEAAGWSWQQAQGFASAFADALLESCFAAATQSRNASSVLFDTISFTRKLDESGFPAQQARIIPEAIAELLTDIGFFSELLRR